jgi:hypothetical protein
MKPYRRFVAAVVLVVCLVVPLGCGEAKQKPLDEQLRDVEIRSLAAYACMPKNLRAELRSLERRHNARVAALTARNVPEGATGGTSAPAGLGQTIENDPVRTRLVARARSIYRQYLPGGTNYEASCYQPQRAAAKERLEKLDASGATGAAGSTGVPGG